MAYACNCGNGDADGFCNGSCLAVDAEVGEQEELEGERIAGEDPEAGGTWPSE